MSSVSIYIEGGGNSSALLSECRRAFSLLFEKAGLMQKMPKIIACGSRGNAYKRFCDNLSKGENVLLLVDSELPVITKTKWAHLKQSDNWDKPVKASENNCFLMVQIMESWFLADIKTLQKFYGTEFKHDKLPKDKIEEITKEDILRGLNSATKDCKAYLKAAHSFKLLAEIDPLKIAAASPHFNALLLHLKAL